jgi:hypothetical protein
MHLILDNIELIKREDKNGGVNEIRSIQNLSIYGSRNIVELPIPGSEGNILQDMGRKPSVIVFDGDLIGPQAATTAQSLKEKFETKNAVPFSSDIALVSDITSVVIEKFFVHFYGGENLGIGYSMLLKEQIANSQSESAQEESEPPSQDEESQQDVQNKIDDQYDSVNSENSSPEGDEDSENEETISSEE